MTISRWPCLRVSLTAAALLLAGGAAPAQFRSPNPGTSSGTSSGTNYPYWGTAPSSYRGESMPSPPIMGGYSTRSASPFAGGAGGMGLPGMANLSYVPPAGRYALEGQYRLRSAYYSPSALAEAAALFPRQPPARGDGVAEITLRLPADAQVWFNGNRARQTGAVRHYFSPQLPPGKEYVYELRVRRELGGKVVEETRRVPVSAGARVSLDLTGVFGRSDSAQ